GSDRALGPSAADLDRPRLSGGRRGRGDRAAHPDRRLVADHRARVRAALAAGGAAAVPGGGAGGGAPPAAACRAAARRVIALAVALDFRISLPAGAAGGTTLTVLTLNSDGDRTPDAKLHELLRTTGAQIVALQECELDPDAFGDDSWHVHREHELCLLSR